MASRSTSASSEGSTISRLAGRLDRRELQRQSLPGGGTVFRGEIATRALSALGARAMTLDRSIIVGDDFESQFRQAFRNLDRVLRTQGSSLDGVMRLNTYLSDQSQYEAFKRIRGEFLSAPYPASTAVVVGFVFPGMLCEIEAIAVRGGARRPDPEATA